MLLAEHNYVIYDKELLAIIDAPKIMAPLSGRKSTSSRDLVRSQESRILSFSAIPLIAAKPDGAYSSPDFASLSPTVPVPSIKQII